MLVRLLITKEGIESCKLKSIQVLKTHLGFAIICPSCQNDAPQNTQFASIQTPQAQAHPLPHRFISLPCSFLFNPSTKQLPTNPDPPSICHGEPSTDHPELPPKLHPIFSMAFDQTPCAKPHSLSNLHHPIQPSQNPAACS